MPIETQLFRRSELTLGGNPLQVMYYYDTALDKWLSVSETSITHGRNATSYTGYLRSINGVQETATHGPMMPYDCTIVWISAKSEVTPDCNIQIISNSVTLQGMGWGSSSQYWAVDLDVSQGNNISVNLPLFVGTYPNRPLVTMGIRWRL